MWLMGTLGCINDMLQRDKENRELRKRNRERLTDTYHRLLDTGQGTDLSQMTVEKMEDIHRKTLEKEELDKAANFKAMLYLALGMALILLSVWLLVGCSGKSSGNNQSAVESDSVLITQGGQMVSAQAQDSICHLPVATQNVKDSVFTEKELQKIQHELRERYARSKIKGTRLDGNIQGWGIEGNYLVVYLCLNSPEARAVFRKKVMDSPAIRFEGPLEPVPDNKRYTSDTLGLHLYPEFSAYPYSAHTATFVLFNQSNQEIRIGDTYDITYEDKQGIWRSLPINTVFNSIAYIIKPDSRYLFKAMLNPYVLPNQPGRYRFFYEAGLIDKDQEIMLMTEFRLADIEKAVRDSSGVINVEYSWSKLLMQSILRLLHVFDIPIVFKLVFAYEKLYCIFDRLLYSFNQLPPSATEGGNERMSYHPSGHLDCCGGLYHIAISQFEDFRQRNPCHIGRTA